MRRLNNIDKNKIVALIIVLVLAIAFIVIMHPQNNQGASQIRKISPIPISNSTDCISIWQVSDIYGSGNLSFNVQKPLEKLTLRLIFCNSVGTVRIESENGTYTTCCYLKGVGTSGQGIFPENSNIVIAPGTWNIVYNIKASGSPSTYALKVYGVLAVSSSEVIL